MYVEGAVTSDFDVASELGKLGVELGFMFSPIISTFPPRYQAAYICEWDAVLPTGILKLIGEYGQLEFLSKRLQFLIRNGNSEGSFSHSERLVKWWYEGTQDVTRMITEFSERSTFPDSDGTEASVDSESKVC